MSYEDDDPGGIYLLDVIVEEEDHVKWKEDVGESCPLDFDYEEPTIFESG